MSPSASSWAASCRAPAGLHTPAIVPVHPASEKLRPQRIREWIWQTTPMAPTRSSPSGPVAPRAADGGATDSLVASHFRRTSTPAEATARELAFEELFLYQAALVSRRGRRSPCQGASATGRDGCRGVARVAALRPRRTSAARSESSMPTSAGSQPMQRLLMGEVGSGKTVHRPLRDARAIEPRAPGGADGARGTLAEQHFRTLESIGAADPARPRCSPGRPAGRPPGSSSTRSPSGEPQLVVGTHALIEDDRRSSPRSRSPWSTSSTGSSSHRRPSTRGPPGASTCAPHDRDADTPDPLR